MGFCDVAPLSRYTKGCPLTSWSRIGKSPRTRSPSESVPCGAAAAGRSGDTCTARSSSDGDAGACSRATGAHTCPSGGRDRGRGVRGGGGVRLRLLSSGSHQYVCRPNDLRPCKTSSPAAGLLDDDVLCRLRHTPRELGLRLHRAPDSTHARSRRPPDLPRRCSIT